MNFPVSGIIRLPPERPHGRCTPSRRGSSRRRSAAPSDGQSYGDLMSGQNLHHLLMLHMLALEDRGEYEQRLELSGAVEHAGGHRARRVIAPLIRRDHHAAAIKPAVHRRGKPDTAEGARLPVHRDRRAHGMIVEQQALIAMAVVDGLVRRPAQAVANLAAVAVDAVANAVEEPPRLPLTVTDGRFFQIWPQRKRRGVSRFVQIVQEVVAASGCVI